LKTLHRARRGEALLFGEASMPQKSIRQALNEALRQEMHRDPRIIVIGEDVAGGAATEGQRDAYGGVLGVTKGLIGEFGEDVADGAAREAPLPPETALLTDVYASYR
jgi:hypothetical protein